MLFFILIAVAAGVYIGFAAPPSGRSVLLVTGGALVCFLAALGIDG